MIRHPPPSATQRNSPVSQPIPVTDEIARLAECKFTNDLEEVVLEVQQNKSMVDTDRCTIRKMLQEFESEGFLDVTINGHELVRPNAHDGNSAY